MSQFPPSDNVRLNSEAGPPKDSPHVKIKDLGAGHHGTFHNNSQAASKSKPRAIKSSWWWWEIGSAAVGIVCMGLIALILSKSDGMLLDAWPLQIKPNSLIAVLTTVGKAAMLVPVTACISQLKWRHFGGVKAAQPLRDLQLFDDASRGPWGALLLLINLRSQVVLGWMLALVTVIGLGVEPSAQQILDFPSRMTRLENVRASIGLARGYRSKAFSQVTFGKTLWQLDTSESKAMVAAILSGGMGLAPPRVFDCPAPATQCSWPDHTTLAMCNTYEDLTTITTTNCMRKRGIVTDQEGEPSNEPEQVVVDCLYDFPGRRPWESPISARWRGGEEAPNNFSTYSVTPFSSKFAISDTNVFGSYNSSLLFFSLERSQDVVYVEDPSQIPFRMSRAEWYLCEQAFQMVTATPQAGLHIEKTTEQPVSATGTSYVLFNSTLPSGATNPAVANISTYQSPATKNEYYTDSSALSTLMDEIGWWSEGNLSVTCYHPQPLSTCDMMASVSSGPMLAMHMSRTADLAGLVANITAAINVQMRTADPGDNANLTVLAGDALSLQTYITVRWQWLVLPVGELVLTIALLALTVGVTWRQPIFKTSILALLVHGLGNDWEPRELEVDQPETIDKLEAWAKGKKAKLGQDGDGLLKFVRC